MRMGIPQKVSVAAEFSRKRQNFPYGLAENVHIICRRAAARSALR
jgi:hypothetical protein